VLPRLLIVKEAVEKRRKRKRRKRKRRRGKILLLLVEGQPDVKIKAIKGGV